MERKTKAVIGAAAGVAAAAAVAGVVMARRSSGTAPVSYLVRAGETGWTVSTNGAETTAATYGTKREAVAAGRKAAAEHAPSHLTIERTDGTTQARHSYGPDES
jgi:hypothetical protein